MANIEITPNEAQALRTLVNDQYVFSQMSRVQQEVLTGIVAALPILEDGIYMYTSQYGGGCYLYFVKDGKHSARWNGVADGMEVSARFLDNWTRLGDLPA